MDNDLNNIKERERIIVLHDIPSGLDDDNDVAKQLSKQYNQVIIFTDPKPIKDTDLLSSEDDIYDPDGSEFYVGGHIYKNGIRYSLVRGIHPYYNSVNIGNNILTLKLDKYGFLRLYRNPVVEGYFYVGPYNPLTGLSSDNPDGDPNEEFIYLVNKEGNEYYVKTIQDGDAEITTIEKYKDISNIFDSEHVTDDNGLEGYYRDFEISVDYSKQAWILMPEVYKDRLLISNTINLESTKYAFELLTNDQTETTKINIEGVDYILMNTISDCMKIRIYYKK